MTPKDIAKTVEILQKNCDFHIGGIITNEQGGEATVNGWLQAAVTGLRLWMHHVTDVRIRTGSNGKYESSQNTPDYTTRSGNVSAAIRIPEIILNCFFEGKYRYILLK